MKRIRNIIMSLMVIYGLFMITTKVNAETITANNFELGTVYKHVTFANVGVVAGETETKFMKLGTTPVYCVEYGTVFNGGSDFQPISMSTYFENNGTYNCDGATCPGGAGHRVISNTTGIENKLSLVGYFGYGYTGHTTEKYYLATQALVFETLYSNNTAVHAGDYNAITNVNYGSTDVATNNDIDITNEKATIKELIENYQTKPNFGTDISKLSDTVKGQTIVLTDANNVLDEFTIVSSNTNVATVSVSDNILTITTVGSGTASIVMTKNYPSRATTNQVYVKGNDATNWKLNQSVATFGVAPTVTDALTVNVGNLGTIIISKTDFSTAEPVPGATIEIYDNDNNLIDSGITGEDGKVTFSGLPVGEYYFIEKDAPEGYVLNDEKMPFSIEKNGQIVESTLPNKKVELPVTADLPIVLVSLLGLGGLAAAIIYYQKNYGMKTATSEGSKNIKKSTNKNDK